MSKKLHVSHVTGVIFRTSLVRAIQKQAEQYALNRELRVELDKALKRLERDNIEKFVQVQIGNATPVVHSLVDWYGEEQAKLLEQSASFRTTKLNKVHEYVSSGTLHNGDTYLVTRI